MSHVSLALFADLKPQNLLVDSKQCTLKVADFGMSRSLPKPIESVVSSSSDQTPSLEGLSLEERPVNKLAVSSAPDPTIHVVTRWYRAPEVGLFDYDTAVDTWAVGCIFAEMLQLLNGDGRDPQPLFPGVTSGLSGDQLTNDEQQTQLDMIFKVIGTPTADDLKFVDESKESNALNKQRLLQMQPRQRADIRKLLPNANPDAIDLLERLLRFDPTLRISIDDALMHPYLNTVRDPARFQRIVPAELRRRFDDFRHERIAVSPDQWRALIAEVIGTDCLERLGLKDVLEGLRSNLDIFLRHE